MAGPAPGPPDLISDMVQPVDLVNSVQRPAVVLAMANGDTDREAVMPVCGQLVISSQFNQDTRTKQLVTHHDNKDIRGGFMIHSTDF